MNKQSAYNQILGALQEQRLNNLRGASYQARIGTESAGKPDPNRYRGPEEDAKPKKIPIIPQYTRVIVDVPKGASIPDKDGVRGTILDNEYECNGELDIYYVVRWKIGAALDVHELNPDDSVCGEAHKAHLATLSPAFVLVKKGSTLGEQYREQYKKCVLIPW